eukprot:947340-Rhodomonas_salina.1
MLACSCLISAPDLFRCESETDIGPAGASSCESKRAALEKDLANARENIKLELRARTELEKNEKALRADISRLQAQ